jgi:hypothetical protein
LHSCNVSWKINLLLTTTSTCLAVWPDWFGAALFF